MFRGLRAAPPSSRYLCHWEAVCRYLDTQPYRSVSYPFPANPPISARLLKRMAAFRLVRHRDSDCRWQLSPRWQATLGHLWRGALDEEADREEAGAVLAGSEVPFVADCGVDTLYAHLLCEGGLPERLMTACDALKSQAQEEDSTVETPWVVLGAPLSMYKAGKGTSGDGRGVSWSYILRNALVMVVLRKTPLSELLGSVRLGADALWTLGARAALDGVRADLETMWEGAAPGSFRGMRWQLSQIHLCADVAHFSPIPADLNRLLTRSVKKVVHLPAADAVEAAYAEPGFDASLADEPWLAGMLPPEWESVPLDAFNAASLDLLGVGDDGERSRAEDVGGDNDDLGWAEEEGAAVHLWGQRASGFAFSPGGDLSATWYDKPLEERLSGKRWMEAIHRAGGWDPSMPLFRVEARFRRGVLRELTPAQPSRGEDGSGAAPRWFDDPWRCLDHLNDLWTTFAGLPPEADTAPDVTYRGWMRLVMPDADDSNRARWPTDPMWETIQRARFTDAAPEALARVPHVVHDLERVDAEIYGLFKLRAVLRGAQLATSATLSLELGAFAESMEEVDAAKGRDFAEEAREKARRLGRPVPLREARVLQTWAPEGVPTAEPGAAGETNLEEAL